MLRRGNFCECGLNAHPAPSQDLHVKPNLRTARFHPPRFAPTVTPRFAKHVVPRVDFAAPCAVSRCLESLPGPFRQGKAVFGAEINRPKKCAFVAIPLK